MRDIQTLFDIIIDKTYYSRWMCRAAEQAFNDDLIDASELDLINEEISTYIDKIGNRHFTLLRDCLNFHGQPCEYEDRLKIYSDWKNRPFF